MTRQIQKNIDSLALQGLGYRRIAAELEISPNTVKSYLQRHPVETEYGICPQCGKPVHQTPGRRKRRFCSDGCRMLYWNSHKNQVKRQAYYDCVCLNCGKKFVSYGNSRRKYCSRDCYYEARRKKSR